MKQYSQKAEGFAAITNAQDHDEPTCHRCRSGSISSRFTMVKSHNAGEMIKVGDLFDSFRWQQVWDGICTKEALGVHYCRWQKTHSSGGHKLHRSAGIQAGKMKAAMQQNIGNATT